MCYCVVWESRSKVKEEEGQAAEPAVGLGLELGRLGRHPSLLLLLGCGCCW